MHALYHPISKNVYSSYHQNDLGETLFLLVLGLKPKKIVEIGTLEGYSAIAMAQALKIIGEGHIYCYDLFEYYEFRNASLDKVRKNIDTYSSIVTLEKKSFDDWEGEDFDLLHFDISNDGHKIREIYRKTKKQREAGGIVVFEGGGKERDEVEWMKKYHKLPISKCGIDYKIIDDRFPSLSIL